MPSQSNHWKINLAFSLALKNRERSNTFKALTLSLQKAELLAISMPMNVANSHL